MPAVAMHITPILTSHPFIVGAKEKRVLVRFTAPGIDIDLQTAPLADDTQVANVARALSLILDGLR